MPRTKPLGNLHDRDSEEYIPEIRGSKHPQYCQDGRQKNGRKEKDVHAEPQTSGHEWLVKANAATVQAIQAGHRKIANQ